jgi:hypothetical protein
VYTFPGNDVKHSDHVFGSVIIQSQRKPLSEITIEFLKEGWTSDIEKTPFDEVAGVLWTYTIPDPTTTDRKWAAEQVWGYAEHDIPGMGRERRYTRKIHFVSPSVTKDVLLVYDQKDVPSTATVSSLASEEDDLSSFGAS